jgi:hypothetical protein
MTDDQHKVHRLYRRLLGLYPHTFRALLGESMEQTFNDLWTEKQQTKQALFGFVVWIFIETAIGIFREHLLRMSLGAIMKAFLQALGVSALLGFLLILPFAIMEVVNRRSFNEDFPVMLFFMMWLSIFAISIILLPIIRGRWHANRDMAHPVPTPGNARLTHSWPSAIMSVVVLLSPGILPLLDSLGWLSLDRLFNGPNPEVAYLPGMFIALGLILFPITAGIIGGGPIVRILRAGGSLFALPIHLIVVVFIVSSFALGLTNLIIDQWPCFIGVPNCD